MFTRSDLSTLLAADPPLAVSVFLPTQTHSADVRQGPIRLKNLTTEAARRLQAAGMAGSAVEAMLAPARRLAEDYGFWQHQSHGLALFLDTTRAFHYRVPVPLVEQVVVGPGFHVRPLLPVLAADGRFVVLTVTAGEARLYHGSRFGLVVDESADLVRSSADVAGERTTRTPCRRPPSRDPTPGRSASAMLRCTATALRRSQGAAAEVHEAARFRCRVPGWRLPGTRGAGGRRRSRRPFPSGHRPGRSTRRDGRDGPSALDETEPHEAAYSVVRPLLDQGRLDAADRFSALLGQGDRRAAVDLGDVVRGAHRGQVEVLLLDETDAAWGRYDPVSDEMVLEDGLADSGQDLLEAAAVHTLHDGGVVHVFSREEMPEGLSIGAILRY